MPLLRFVQTSSLNDIKSAVDKIKTLNLTSKITEVSHKKVFFLFKLCSKFMQPKEHFRDTMLPGMGTQTSLWSGELAISHSQKQKHCAFERWLSPSLKVCLLRCQVENFYNSIPARVSQETATVVTGKRSASAPAHCHEARTKAIVKRDFVCVSHVFQTARSFWKTSKPRSLRSRMKSP